MLLIGFLSLFQIGFLPGYLCLRAFRLPVQGQLQTALYSFALSLIANHTLVYALFSAGVYSAPVMFAIVALELMALLYLTRRFRVSFPSEETLARYRDLWRDRPVLGRLIAIPAFAALLAAALLSYQYFGSVFVLNDDVLSWDRWAVEWATNQLPSTGLYPQLLPTNWSISYVMLGNTDVKMFGKAIMPLFVLATLLLFLDLFHRTGRLTWLLGLSCYAFLLWFLFPPVFLASGYTEIASAFFAFLTLHAFLQGGSRPLPVMLFASGTVLTKQGGVYIFALALGWTVVHFARLRDRVSWRAPALLMVLVLLVNWRWVVTEWRVWNGQVQTNIAFLTGDIHGGKTYAQRWVSSWRRIESVRGEEFRPLVRIIAAGVLLSLFDPHGRMVFLLLFAPFYALWSLLFSYEVRTLAMDLPFAADCLGCGSAAAARFAASRFSRDSFRRYRWPAWLGGCILAALLGASFWNRVQSSQWLIDMADSWKWPMTLGCLTVLGAAAVKRISPLRFQLHTLAVLALSAGAVAVAQTTRWSSAAILREQLEKRKSAGSESLNRRLYQYAEQKPLKGKILTDNFFLAVLPELNTQQIHVPFPQPATPEFLESVLADREAGYILAYSPAFPPATLNWMTQRGFQSVFEEKNYRFFELPANRPIPGMRVLSIGFSAPSGGKVKGWIRGFGFRKGDLLVVGGKDQYPVTFRDERLLEFTLPAPLPAGSAPWEVVRPGGVERSPEFHAAR